MNFKKLIFIIYTFSLLSGQAISTPKTIKPVIELDPIDETSAITFIGFEGDTQKGGTVDYKVAKLYSISKNNQLFDYKNKFNLSLEEAQTSYFSGAEKGDITGDGIPEAIFFISDPTTGTRVYSYTINPGFIFTKLHDPYMIRGKQKQPTLLHTNITKIYEDKDNEIIVSFGAPDRKIMILNYSGELTAKTIGRKFLANNVGVIKFRTPDINNDNLSEIYILSNNPGLKEEKIYFSKQHKETEKPKTIDIKENIKDVVFIKPDKNQNPIKIFLLDNNKLFVEKWNKKIALPIEKTTQIIGSENNKVIILNEKGSIATLEIEENNTLHTNTIKPNFQNTGFTQTEHLMLKDGRIIISHNKEAEIILKNINLATKDKQKNKPAREAAEEQVQQETKIKDKDATTNSSSASAMAEKIKEEKKPKEKIWNEKEQHEKMRHSSIDTVFINVGRENTFDINLSPEHTFVNLEKKQGPRSMILDRKKLIFKWNPQKENIGYNKLIYDITYNTSKEFEEYFEEGIQKLKQKEELFVHEHTHVIFVNAPPIIKISPTTMHTALANKEIVIPIYINDPNPEHNNKLNIAMFPTRLEKANIKDRKFYWTPQNKHFGKNKIDFVVSDGILEATETIEIEVDTVKIETGPKLQDYATVNEEFLHKIPLTRGAQASILEAPENVRISTDGYIHWIPTKPQLEHNTITLEISEENQTIVYPLNVFVNAPPVISYRPNDIEFINLNDTFNFHLKSFDENEEQSLYWTLANGPEGMIFNNGRLAWDANQPDYHLYTIELTDTLDADIFSGKIYVNDIPKIISTPETYITLGKTYIYDIVIKDLNQQSPTTNENYISTFLKHSPTGMQLENNKIEWTPTLSQLGANLVELEVFDEITTIEQTFTIYVNDVPEIISSDSLRVAVGDTLHHFIKAKDSNGPTTLTYGIQSNLDTMTITPRTGEIVWSPTDQDIGYHTIQASVSDEFSDLGKDIQPITIFVYKNPEFLDNILPEAYAGVEYTHRIKAENMNKQDIPETNIFVNLLESNFKEIMFDKLTYELQIIPSFDEIGVQYVSMSLEDTFSNKIIKNFPIKVLTSPCEISDTTYISTNDQNTIERSSHTTQQSYYKKEKSILDQSNYVPNTTPTQYIEIAELNKVEIIDTVFLTSQEIEKYFPELSGILKQKKTSNSLTKQELRKLKKIQRKKLKQSKKKPSKKANITFNQAQQETQFNKEISFKPPPPIIPEKIDLHKVKNETTKKTVLAVMGAPEKPDSVKPKEITEIKEPTDLGHNVIGDKTHITDNKWHANKTAAKDSKGQPLKNIKGETVIKLNYDKAFYYPGEEFNYKTEYWNGIKGKRKTAN